MNYCSKTNSVIADRENPNDQIELIDKSKTIHESVLAFKAKMEYSKDNPNIKNGNTMQVDSALFYMEATINYSFTFPWYEKRRKEFIESLHDTIISSKTVLLTDQRVTQLYWEIVDQIRADYIGSGFTNKKLLDVDLSFFNNGQGGYQIKIITIITSTQPDPPELWQPPYEDWKYGYNDGFCDNNMPPSTDDAGIILTYEVNNSYPSSSTTEKWYNTDNIVVNFIYSQYPNPYSIPNNYKDYYIFYAQNYDGLTIGDNEECVDGSEISFYKNSTATIIDQYITCHPGYTFAECWIDGEKIFETIPPYNLQYIHHKTDVSFVVSMQRESNDLPVDID